MSTNALQKKLLIKPGQRLIILNAPPGYAADLGPLPADVDLADKPDGIFDFVHLFVKDSEELAQWLPVAQPLVKADGLFWISYPKQSAKVASDLNRDILWRLMESSGLRPVTQVSINAIWSALRFRPADRVAAKKG